MRRILYSALIAELAILASALVFGIVKTKNEGFASSWMMLVPLGATYGLFIADKLFCWLDKKHKANFLIGRWLFIGLIAGFIVVNLPFVSGLRTLDYDPGLDSSQDVFRLLNLGDLWLGVVIGMMAVLVINKTKRKH